MPRKVGHFTKRTNCSYEKKADEELKVKKNKRNSKKERERERNNQRIKERIIKLINFECCKGFVNSSWRTAL